MNKQTRKRYANKVRVIVEAAGAILETCDDRPEYQETYVRICFPNVSLSFDIGDRVQEAVVCHWHDAKRDLKMCGTFYSINEYHKRKATSICDDMDCLLNWLPIAAAKAMTRAIYR